MALFPSLRNRHGFFSDYYLGTVFGRAGGRRRSLINKDVERAWRAFVAIRLRAEGRAADAAQTRERFIRPLLGVFDYHLGAPDGRIAPLYASAEDEAAGRPPLLLAWLGAWDEDLDGGRPSAMRRLADALAKARLDLRYGLLLTGERIRLARRAGDGPAGACLELDLEVCLEDEDKESFAAALGLLSAASFRPDAEGRLRIDEVERESREHASRVSDDLKRAVFESSETLVQALLDDHASRDGADTGGLAPERLAEFRDAALVCLYRMLFIRYAEARDERLRERPLYRDSYSLDGLVGDLLRARDEPSGGGFGLWDRLLALFAIHDRGLPGAQGLEPIPARRGELFDPATPAGRILEEARLDDRAVARVVRDLTTTAPRRGIGREQVSFRELDIEQLGAVYEGLLEYEPRVATQTLIEVRGAGRTLVLPPAELVRLCREKQLRVKGDAAVVEGTEAAALHPQESEEAEEEDLEPAEDAEGEAREEEKGIGRGADALLVRRIEPGRFLFVPGPARKGSGSFYTPLPLVQDLVRHALGPLVEDASAAEIESLRVLDPACGSAHFLVEAMRFLGRALHRAYVREHAGKAPPHFRGIWDATWEATDEEARAAASEARAWCKRRIAERCLYGVDLNPTAVSLARVSLWIESLSADRPLTYFAHHVRCGNSILGTWLERLGEPLLPELRARGGVGMPDLFAEPVKEAVRKAAEIRRLIDTAADAGAVEPDSLEEQRFKERQRAQAEDLLAAARLLFDLRSVSAFVPAIWADWQNLCSRVEDAAELERYARSRDWWNAFAEVRRRERFFHWELEFPEVFLAEAGGFDAVLGNPPWDEVKADKREFYGRHDVLIRAFVGGELDRRIGELHDAHPGLAAEFKAFSGRVKILAACLKKGRDYRFQDWAIDGKTASGRPDLSKFFVERAWRLARPGGRVGSVVPSAIYNNEGCTGLRNLLLREAQVERFYAFENRRKIFPIDSRYKFASLVFRKGAPSGDGFQAAFMRHDLAELADPGPKPWMVLVHRSELERLSPGTLAFLEYRGPRDREILLKMYGYDADGNPVNPRPLLGDQGPGTWNARFYNGLDMSANRDLWTDPRTGKLWSPRQILGPVPGTTAEPPYYDTRAWPEIRARMADADFWPMYEGKHIEQFLMDIRPIERWVSLEACKKKYGKPPDRGPKVVFRRIASNTNERTCIAAVLPEGSCTGDTLTEIASALATPEAVATLLNTIAVDFAVRLRTAGTHLDFTFMARVATPPWAVASCLPTVPTRSAIASGAQHIANLDEAWAPVWSANCAVAAAYDLDPASFEHILDTFPVFARKRPEFFDFLCSELKALGQVGGGRRA